MGAPESFCEPSLNYRAGAALADQAVTFENIELAIVPDLRPIERKTWPISLGVALLLHGGVAAAFAWTSPVPQSSGRETIITVELATEEAATRNDPVQSPADREQTAAPQAESRAEPEKPEAKEPMLQETPEATEQVKTETPKEAAHEEAASASAAAAATSAPLIDTSAKSPVPGADQSRLTKAVNDWRRSLAARIQRFHRYPAGAHGARGEAQVAFSIDRDGHVISRKIIGSSGSDILDHDAIALIARAAPFPTPPAGASSEILNVLAPVRYASAMK